MSERELILPADYGDRLVSLKQRIRGARSRAVLAANEEQIRLYHEIGRDILVRQEQQGWGAKVIDRLASDLKYMRFFDQECPDCRIGQQPADQLPWPSTRPRASTSRSAWPNIISCAHCRSRLILTCRVLRRLKQSFREISNRTNSNKMRILAIDRITIPP